MERRLQGAWIRGLKKVIDSDNILKLDTNAIAESQYSIVGVLRIHYLLVADPPIFQNKYGKWKVINCSFPSNVLIPTYYKFQVF